MGHSLVHDLFPQLLSLVMAWRKAGFPFDKVSLPVDFVGAGLTKIPNACLHLAVPMAVTTAIVGHDHSTTLAVTVRQGRRAGC